MNSAPVLLSLAVIIASTLWQTRAEEAEVLRCRQSEWLAGPESSDYRKYAPDREIDILNVALDVTPDFQRRTIEATATLTFKPIAKPTSEIQLDAMDLDVKSVTGSARVQAFQVTDKKLIITFAEPLLAGQETSVKVAYAAVPTRGLYFRTPEMGYKAGEAHLFTQGEAIEARHWYPCFDAPNEKFTSEITCRAPEGMTVLSNGRLIAQEKDTNGLVAVHWKQEQPHVNYLMSLVAGYFKKVEATYRDIPLAFYTLPSEIEQAESSFRETSAAMAFFEKDIGVPYPWPKYYQVCVNDFVAGGMENTSITTLTDGTLFTDATETIRSSHGLVAHELAHQWFGDLVTCKDWSHLWLNEGFATYYAHLYDGARDGRDALLYGLYQSAKGITDRTDDTKPIVYRKYQSPDEQFSYLAYAKGGWVLHMLRSQLGDELYRRCIQTYLERHRFDTVVTEDLNQTVEVLSGRSFDRFFDQWVYHAHHPELEIRYSWDEGQKLARLSVSQNQKVSDDVLLFHFPLPVRFQVGASTVDRQIQVKEKSEDFYFALPEAPKLVRIDPELTLLAKTKFSPPDPMWPVQLTNRSDAVGRLLAIEHYATKKDKAAVDKLQAVLNKDEFYGCRSEAARALRTLHTDEAFAALTNSLAQPDARVRQQVLSAVGSFYRPEAFEVLARRAAEEKNPDITAEAVRALAAYPRPESRERLISLLDSTSYHNALADAAVSAMRTQADPAYVQPLEKALKARATAFTSHGFGRGLEALAYLARNEERKEAVRDFLLAQLNDRRQPVRLAAIRALGTLGEPTAIAPLQTFTRAGKESPERDAANKAVAAIRELKKPQDDLHDLRNEVLELQKQNREFKEQLDDLKKRMESSKPAEKERKE